MEIFMSEKEKMLNGEDYYPTDEELEHDRKRAKQLCFEYNSTPPDKQETRKSIIKKLFGKAPDDFLIESNFFCDYGYNIEAGKRFYTNHNCVMLDCCKITFGDYVMVGPNCGFYTALHPLDSETRITLLESAKPITVGHRVWIGGNVTVLPGVSIGDDSVIGAGSVVTKDIPSGVIAAGNPCKILRKIPSKNKNQ